MTWAFKVVSRRDEHDQSQSHGESSRSVRLASQTSCGGAPTTRFAAGTAYAGDGFEAAASSCDVEARTRSSGNDATPGVPTRDRIRGRLASPGGHGSSPFCRAPGHDGGVDRTGRVWEDALRMGRGNREIIELARRHCLDMQFVSSGGGAMAEAQTGLPIDPRQIQCRWPSAVRPRTCP